MENIYTDREKLKEFERSWLGKTIEIGIDRPIGYVHVKGEKTLHYPINYGYIQETLAADGEEEDAYVLGITEPVSEFTGRIIAIINRENDIEHKWVVAPDGMTFTQEEIAELTHFQEQYFKSTISLLYKHL